MQQNELLIDPKTGDVRQAGAERTGNFVRDFRRRAQSSLYFFAKGVLGLDRLTPTLHRPAAEFMQRFPPYRKLLLMPRDHLKTSLIRSLAIHMLLQDEDSNCYMPGKEGASMRILLANETATNAQHQLRWIAQQFESNRMLRALWPHRTWMSPKSEAKKWNEQEIVLPRAQDYPEASIETIGVGGAVTGRHYDVMLKDDLVTLEAANSPQQMLTAIEWHKASRALMDDPDKSLEMTIGTRWAVHDLYEEMQRDPSVEHVTRRVVEDGVTIFPEMFSLDTVQRLKDELGPLFPLLYMNSAADPELTDFDMDDVRKFQIQGNAIVFHEEERDVTLRERLEATGGRFNPKPPRPGVRMTPEMQGDIFRLRTDAMHKPIRRLRASGA